MQTCGKIIWMLKKKPGHSCIFQRDMDYGFLGVELISELGTGIQFVDPLQVYAPKRNVNHSPFVYVCLYI